MRLESVKYSEFEGNPQEWTLEGLRLRKRNLIVGRNAAGKTRVLNVISALASQLAGSTCRWPSRIEPFWPRESAGVLVA
jgi:recombinational DNA repair ATPase RecF